ncbi:hypothetical protein [Vibrio alginolyticus]|uniref:hypothetical protein n=1 Tax=Vibrio alginolyticus TaxID=663 RepID=UPI001BD4A2E4|nr:hypothetical protein [Vibrio alginolyticus]MBT0011072.1 hypothetical protein [Vibrio alginolyticus]MBT0039118.1 hypothetical protein [Vibrio alginolyticus]
MQFKQLTKGDVVYVRRTVNVNSGWCTRTLGTFFILAEVTAVTKARFKAMVLRDVLSPIEMTFRRDDGVEHRSGSQRLIAFNLGQETSDGVVTDQLKECCKLARDIRDVRHLVNVNDIDPMQMTQALCDEVLAVIAKLPRKANGY